MKAYRIYIVDRTATAARPGVRGDGHTRLAELALGAASKGHVAELWEGGRIVGRVSEHGVSSPVTGPDARSRFSPPARVCWLENLKRRENPGPRSLDEPLMNFDFSDDQKFLKGEARKFLDAAARPPWCAACWTIAARPTTRPCGKRWPSRAGWARPSPRSTAGLGLGHIELCAIAEELGRALAPIPFASTVYFLAEALMLAGSEEQKAALAAEDRRRRGDRLLRHRRRGPAS